MSLKKSKSLFLEFRNITLLDFYSVNGLGWIKIFKYGLYWKNAKTRGLLFSERNGYTKYIKIKDYIFILKRNK